jgi:hypothetical protein
MGKRSTKTNDMPVVRRGRAGTGRVCRKDVYSSRRGVPRNNCWAYAVLNVTTRGPSNYKLQPGELSGKSGTIWDLSCRTLAERTKADLAQIGGGPVPFDEPCAKGHYKIALIIAPGIDYHYLVHHQDVIFKVNCDRQTRASIAKKFKVPLSNVELLSSYRKGTSVFVKDASCWSHKRGTAFPPTLMDSRGKIIKDPRKSVFDYGALNYTVFCSTFCVKNRKVNTATIVERDGDMNVSSRGSGAHASTVRATIRRLKKSIGL